MTAVFAITKIINKTCYRIDVIYLFFVTTILPHLTMASLLITLVLFITSLILAVDSNNQKRREEYDPTSTKVIPMEKLNLWIDGKETEQFVGKHSFLNYVYIICHHIIKVSFMSFENFVKEVLHYKDKMKKNYRS